MLTFHSVDSENNKVIFHSEYVKEGNTYIFPDKSAKNTTVYLTVHEDRIELVRKGETEMNLTLAIGEKYVGNYKNSMGLAFEFYTDTRVLKIEKNKMEIEYSLFVSEEEISSHKIWILIH